MKPEEIGCWSDVLFVLEGKGFSQTDATELALQIYHWGFRAAVDRLRPSRPAPSDAPPLEQLPLIDAEPAKPKAKREPKKAAHRIPEDFTLTPELRKYATDRNFSPQEIDAMWTKFYSHSKANGKEFVDWNHAWLTWVMRGVEYKNRQQETRNTGF